LDVLLFERVLDGRPGPAPQAESIACWQVSHFTTHVRSGDARIDARLSPERECYAVHVAARLAHVSWVHLRTRLPRQCGFAAAPVVGDAVTWPEFRGRGVFAFVLCHVAADLAVRGARAVQGIVVTGNWASVRSFEHAGYTQLAQIRGVWVGGQLLRRTLS
jgi:hypothetical protein